MKPAAARRANPIARLAAGLVALIVSLVLLADLMFGMLPARSDQQRELRKRVTENLAIQLTALAEGGDTAALGRTIQSVLARDPEILSITMSRADGSMVLQRGPTASPLDATRMAASTLDLLRVPILAAGAQPWGEVIVRFVPPAVPTIRSTITEPMVQLVLIVGIAGFVLFYLYLKRAMYYLNPSASVPDRVRKAFDSLVEGLVILDQKGRVVLANRAFRALHPEAETELHGQPMDAMAWLVGTAPRDGPDAAFPWTETLRGGETVAGRALTLKLPEGELKQLLISSSPITDNKGRVRGCLVNIDNVTAVHHANEELRRTLRQLEDSQAHIESQNVELRRLASRDTLTGCFNRRAFFESAEDLFAQARRTQTPLACLMIDIDHFKQFNDRYGHAVGDQVIQVVAKSLGAGLRQVDVLGRYGGEEFCIVLPNASLGEAQAVAERLRADIEARANRGIRGVEVMPITASLGLAMLGGSARNLEALVDQADQALYQSKKGGRNRVTVWTVASAPAASPPPAAEAANAAGQPA
jgi:diguanylate cyclase (GGDEF)-like protein/PAS domain S-box-containing protein